MDNLSKKTLQNNSGAFGKKSSQNLRESNSHLSRQKKNSKKEDSLYTNEGDGGQLEIEAGEKPQKKMIHSPKIKQWGE